MASKDPRLASVRPNGMEDVPQYRVDVDWAKAGALGIPITAIHNTISEAFGSAYVNNFVEAAASSVFTPRRTPPTACSPETSSGYTCATRPGKWCPSPPSPPAAGRTARRGWSVITALPLWASGARRPPAGAPERRCRRWRRSTAKLPAGSATNGRSFPTRSGWQAPRRRSFMHFPSWSSSCA